MRFSGKLCRMQNQSPRLECAKQQNLQAAILTPDGEGREHTGMHSLAPLAPHAGLQK